MGPRVPGEKPLRASLWATSLGRFCSRARKGRRACKVLRLWNLNSCIEKIDAKCWLAEMTFCKYEVIALGTCFSMFVSIHAHFHFVLIGRNLTAQSIGSHKGIERGIQIPETVASSPSFSHPTARTPQRVCSQAAQSKGEKPTWGFRPWPYLCW